MFKCTLQMALLDVAYIIDTSFKEAIECEKRKSLKDTSKLW